MGVSIRLFIHPQHIPPSAWAEVYDDALRLLRRYEGGLLRLREEPTPAGARLCLTPEIEAFPDHPGLRHLSICGDAQGRRIGDSFTLHRDLTRYPPRRGAQHDILFSHLLGPWPGVAVFSGDTGGEPYHQAVLAVAMLIEDRFPEAASLGGDLRPDEVARAQARVQAVLGRIPALPACLEATVLCTRLLRTLQPDDVPATFHAIYRGEPGTGLSVLLGQLGAAPVHEWMRARLRGLRSPRHPEAQQLLVSWLNATGDLGTLCRMACLDPGGPHFPAGEMMAAVAATWITCEPAELAFLRPLQRPPGEAQTALSQAVEVLMEWRLAGLALRRHLSLPDAVGVVQRCFAGTGEDPGPALARQTRRQQRRLDRLRARLERAVALLEHGALLLRNGGDVRAARALADLPAERQRALRWFAFGVLEFGRRIQQRAPRTRRALTGTPRELRGRAVHLLERQRFVLLQSSWEAIDDETDPQVLHFLLLLALIRSTDDLFCSLRQALLDNLPLLRELAGRMAEAPVLEQTRAEVMAARQDSAPLLSAPPARPRLPPKGG